MREGEFLENLPPEEKKRLGYIEGRADIFRTKVFEIGKEGVDKDNPDEKNVVVVSRDPGSANALWPVVELLQKKKDLRMKVVTDGRAQEIFQGKFKTKDITPQGNILEAAGIIGSPDAALIDSSEERGIEMFFTATFNEVPVVLVEDYYTSCRGYLERLKDRHLPYPQKICVIDEEAKNLVAKRFPELADAVEVTGQPAFDRFAHEDTKKIAKEVKKELGIGPKEKLVTFMSTIERMELIQRLAEELAKVEKGFKFTFRIHPRDNTPLKDYEREFKERNIDYITTAGISTDRIGAASDLVITTISTEGLHAICRRKPTIHITDARFAEQYEDLTPPPPVKLGASVGLDKMENLAVCVGKLLDSESKENQDLMREMQRHYPVDGKNAKRVAKALEGVLDT